MSKHQLTLELANGEQRKVKLETDSLAAFFYAVMLYDTKWNDEQGYKDMPDIPKHVGESDRVREAGEAAEELNEFLRENQG